MIIIRKSDLTGEIRGFDLPVTPLQVHAVQNHGASWSEVAPHTDWSFLSCGVTAADWSDIINGAEDRCP